MMVKLEDIRKEYAMKKLDGSTVELNPFIQFYDWFEDVIRAGIDEPSAMFLATVGKDWKP